jgi:hypothetical protein
MKILTLKQRKGKLQMNFMSTLLNQQKGFQASITSLQTCSGNSSDVSISNGKCKRHWQEHI